MAAGARPAVRSRRLGGRRVLGLDSAVVHVHRRRGDDVLLLLSTLAGHEHGERRRARGLSFRGPGDAGIAADFFALPANPFQLRNYPGSNRAGLSIRIPARGEAGPLSADSSCADTHSLVARVL